MGWIGVDTGWPRHGWYEPSGGLALAGWGPGWRRSPAAGRGRPAGQRSDWLIAVLVGLLVVGLAWPASRLATPEAGAGRTALAATAALTEAAALQQARAAGHPVEVGSLRGESREVYAQPDGTFEAVQHQQPVRTRQGGRWVDIDTTLARRPDGTVAPAAASVGLVFSGGGSGPMATLSQAGRSLSLTWPGLLPAPELAGPDATYRDVLPGVDLRLHADGDGFSHVLVVRSRRAAGDPRLARLTFGLRASGLTIKPDDGGLRADATGGGALFEAARPLMWDAAPQAATPDPGRPADAGTPPDGARRAPVGVSVGKTAMTLTPDRAMLADPATRFPVSIDPVYKTVKSSARLMVSSGGWEDYNFDGDEGLGFCPYSYTNDCGTHHVKRLFYRMPTSGFGGRTILSAEFQVKETFAPSCTTRTVQLWKTKAFISSSTWNSTSDNWLEHLDSRDVAKGYSGCPSGDVVFDATAAMKEAAAGDWSTLTLGLRAATETDQLGWKRFSDTASLRVHYNTPPPQPAMKNLWSSPGGGCAGPGAAARVNAVPTAHATLSDPDKDKLYAEFRISWDDTAGHHDTLPARIGPYASGTDFTQKLPAAVPEGVTANWSVRAYDGTSYSPWSYAGNATACYYVYDHTAPAPPVITSPAYADGGYPPSNPDDENDPWYAGVGRYGTFTFTAVDPDVVTYTYGILGDPAGSRTVATVAGAARTVQVMPTAAGVNVLQVAAADAAGNRSVQTYGFRVSAGAEAAVGYPLDEPVDATAVLDGGGANPATVHGGVTLGVDGITATGMQLNGSDGYAATAGPVLDTTASFSVAAWARLPATKPDHAGIIATQAGAQRSGFELYYSASQDRWAFNRYATDTAGAAIVRATSTAAPRGGDWAHLVGVYDAVAGTLTLYVNGAKAQTVPYTGGWSATGPLQLGAGSYGAVPGSFFAGDIDDVRIFDRVVTGEEVEDLFVQRPVVAARWRLNDAAATVRAPKAYWKLDEAAGATRAEDVQGAYPAGVHGGAAFGTAGRSGKALHLPGPASYASTTGPVVDTTASFSVSAWVRLAAKATSPVVISQEGSVGSGFAVYYSGTYDRWIFNMQTPDAATPSYVRAQSTAPPQLNTWTQLTGVYDATARQLRLYVNGIRQQTVDQPNVWSAAGPLDLGRFRSKGAYTSYFTGDLDDVRVFGLALTDSEAALLGGLPAASTSADDSAGGHHLTLYGNAYVDQGGGWVGDPPGALVLDGDGDYAGSGPVITSTAESFTVAGWVQTAGRPGRAVAVFSQQGAVNSGFTLRYAPDPADPANAGCYQVDMPDADTVGARHQLVNHSSFQSDGTGWDHVAVVYDAFAHELRLYVNGTLQETDSGVSYRDNTVGFAAGNAFQVGRTTTGGVTGEYLPGLVDDVWAFNGAATGEQIAQLASGAELPTTSF